MLHIAAKMGHTEIMGFLLNYCRQSYSHLSSCRPSRKLIDINITDANNRTPLQVAAERGQCHCNCLSLLCFSQTADRKHTGKHCVCDKSGQDVGSVCISVGRALVRQLLTRVQSPGMARNCSSGVKFHQSVVSAFCMPQFTSMLKNIVFVTSMVKL